MRNSEIDQGLEVIAGLHNANPGIAMERAPYEPQEGVLADLRALVGALLRGRLSVSTEAEQVFDARRAVTTNTTPPQNQ